MANDDLTPQVWPFDTDTVMYLIRFSRFLPLLWVAALVGAPAVLASEPNNTPATATVLPSGQLIVSDSLDGTAGRPDTIVGLFDPSFSTLLDSDDNSSPLGNNYASQLAGVPIRPDGSIYFEVTGAPDSTFIGNHTQEGKYAWYLDVRDPNGQLVPSLSQWQNDEISPFSKDSIWLDPSTSPDPLNPNWTGYTVDMTINNIVGPGSGDSLDFFYFTGLQPFEPFTATLTADFAALIGLYDATNTRIATSSLFDPIPTLVGTADFLGRVKIGVTGAVDTNFTGAHVAAGDYTLQLSVVPEPAGVVMLGLGAGLIGLGKLKRSRQRRKTFC